ncbi:MAG: hypothetical protein JSS79_07795 [Bacteroidetes bacterium]|nr:hypothetical protein [Bacteroidota bacterium]
MIDNDFIENNLHIYLFYPEVFSGVFISKKNKQLIQRVKHLNISGYLFYRSMLEIDKSVDQMNTGKRKKIESHYLPILSSLCQEESIKLLTTVFPIKSAFWNFWAKRREEYLTALSIDKGKSTIQLLSDYETYADYKSAFGKIAIDSVFVLSGRKSKRSYQALLQSHKYFSTALQLLDDLLDFREDLIHPQFNFGLFLLRQRLSEKAIDASSLDNDTLSKHLYLQGVAEEMILLALNYFKKSMDAVTGFDLAFWNEAHVQKIRSADTILTHIRSYNATIHAKVVLSKRLFSDAGKTGDMSEQLKLSLGFIQKNQNEDGSWNDFQNRAGISNVWSTGFILSNLLNVAAVSPDAINRSVGFLKQNKKDGMWGYNSGWIPDIDSSTFVLLALSMAQHSLPKELPQWEGYQKRNGGFSTYMDKKALVEALDFQYKDVTGWTQSHSCVSSAAFYFLSKCGLTGNTSHKKALKYILSIQSANHLWPSYWWTSPVYSTSYALRGLIHSGYSADTDIVFGSLNALAHRQNEDGSFSTELNEKSAFFTALALSAFTSSKQIANLFKESAKSAASWLLHSQYDDGSFPSSYCLQIPDASICDTGQVQRWEKSTAQSTNIVIDDFMRLFSTSVAIQALSSYRSLHN